jgi:lactoylglutathione lyase
VKFCWVTITVKELKESLSFYTDVVGLTVDRQSTPRPGTEIAFLGSGPTKVELIWHEQADTPHYGKGISIGFEVDSVDALIETLRGKGITEVDGPYQPTPAIKFFYIEDPNGVRVQFVENISTGG